jgi:crotonobetainyl-CoA:carnitine CoA-transferase CaiB-like acyl-CoA transferase
MKPLDGKLVLDLTRLLPGALVTRSLASFGAEVWKVEAPGHGDYARNMPPLINGKGAYFWLTNSGKKSIVLDLKHEQGMQVFLQLVSKADVLIESFRPGVMERLELGYEQLSQCNARLIYVALTGYGQDGPYAQKAGHDLNYAALGGLLHPTNVTKPSPLGVQVADVSGAQHAMIGILLALLARERTGQGQKVDISILESILPLLTVPLAEYAATGKPEGAGFLAGKYACYTIYEAGDGRFLALGALEQKFWSSFCAVIGCEKLIPEQFAETKQPDLIATLGAVFKRKTADQWLALFHNVDTCITPVNDVAALLRDPQLAARQAFAELEGARASVRQLGAAPKLSQTPGSVGGRPPLLGEHTHEILTTAGFFDSEISELVRLGIVHLAPPVEPRTSF